MREAIAALFSLFSSFFRAGEQLGQAAENLGKILNEGSGALLDETRADREIKVMQAQDRRETLRLKLEQARANTAANTAAKTAAKAKSAGTTGTAA